MDDLTVWTLAVVFGLTALTVLLTGPGMWSEKWGWWIFRDRRKGKTPPEERPPRTR